MATRSNDVVTTLYQDELPDFVLVRTADVDEGDRLRPVDLVWAQALGQMMIRDGQDTPIQVCRLPGRATWTLVAGAHRLAGARSAEIELLRAEIVSADRDDRRLREVRENLWRSDLAPFDRAAFIAEAVSIYKRRAGIDPNKDGRTASVTARWQKSLKEEADDTTATIAVVYGWSDQVGEQIGLSARTVRDDLLLYRRLSPSIVAALRASRHSILTNATQLRALAKLDGAAQQLAVDRLIAGAKSVAEATKPLGNNRPADPEAKRLSAFIGAFSRMGVAEKKAALFQLAGMLPPGVSLPVGEQRPAKPTFPAEHVAYRDEALEAIDGMRDLVEGLLEDDAVPGERGADLRRASGKLQLARFTIAGNGFELGAAA